MVRHLAAQGSHSQDLGSTVLAHCVRQRLVQRSDWSSEPGQVAGRVSLTYYPKTHVDNIGRCLAVCTTDLGIPTLRTSIPDFGPLLRVSAPDFGPLSCALHRSELRLSLNTQAAGCTLGQPSGFFPSSLVAFRRMERPNSHGIYPSPGRSGSNEEECKGTGVPLGTPRLYILYILPLALYPG